MKILSALILGVCLFIVLTTGAWGQTVIRVPQDEDDISQALTLAESGDVIAAEAGFTDEPTEPLRMKPGVSIVPQAGTGIPTIDSSADTAIVFDTWTSSSAASISGFRITGFTDVGVVGYGNAGEAELAV